jgi:DNA-binding IclR family transcriptional regulator
MRTCRAEEYAGDKQFATTLARGLELLHCFTPERPILGNGEMASMLGLPKATISRLSYTLLCLGYLATTEYYGKYRLGPATLSLGYPLLAQYTLRRSARPLMHKLATTLGCSVSIGIRDRYSMVYIEVARQPWTGLFPRYRQHPSAARNRHGKSLPSWLHACRPRSLINQIKIRTTAVAAA